MFGIWDGHSGKSHLGDGPKQPPHPVHTGKRCWSHHTFHPRRSTSLCVRGTVPLLSSEAGEGSFCRTGSSSPQSWGCSTTAQQHNNHGWDTPAQTPHSVDSGGGRSWNPFPWNRNAGAQGTNHPDGTPIFFKNVVKRANADVGRGIPGRSVTPAAP